MVGVGVGKGKRDEKRRGVEWRENLWKYSMLTGELCLPREMGWKERG